MFEPIDPLSFIGLALCPGIFSNSFGFAIDIFPVVSAAVGEHLEAGSLLVVAFPMPFVYSIIVIDHNSNPVATPIYDFSIIGRLSILFEFEVLGGFEFAEVDDI